MLERHASQRGVNLPNARPFSKNREMFPHGFHVAADERSAQRVPRPQAHIILHRLPQDRLRETPRLLGRQPRHPSSLLHRDEEGQPQRRSKGSPGVIRSFLRTAKKETLATQVAYQLPRQPQRAGVAFECKRHALERGSRACHERHQWMDRRHRCPPLPERSKFSAGQGSAGMKNVANSSLPGGRERLRGDANLAIGNADPQQLSVECSGADRRRARRNFAGKRPGALPRTSPIAADDLGNKVAGFAQGGSQDGRQTSGAYDRDSWSAAHARKDNILPPGDGAPSSTPVY